MRPLRGNIVQSIIMLNSISFATAPLIAYEQEIKRIMDNRATEDYIIVRAEQSKFDYLFSAIMPNFLRT